LLVASTYDRSARLFEFSPRHVRRVDPSGGSLTTTNHFQVQELADAQQSWLIPNSLHRLERLSALCALPRRIDVQGAQSFLLDAQAPESSDGEPFNCLFNPGTIYSAVIAPEDGRLWLRANDRPGRSYVELDLAALRLEAEISAVA
jgi:hypothetical protein